MSNETRVETQAELNARMIALSAKENPHDVGKLNGGKRPRQTAADHPEPEGPAPWGEDETVPQSATVPPLNWTGLQGKEPLARDWAVNPWLPMNHPALLAGRGGIGKTMLAQAMGTCLALGRDYVGTVEHPRRVLLWLGEDDENEIHRRQIDLCNWLRVDLAELHDRLMIYSYTGRDITLAGPVYGALVPTPNLRVLREQVGDYKIEYAFLDNVARIFGGNENDRHQVTTFVNWLVGATLSAGFCLLAHPGKAQGSEYSGSTAWEGAVRARLYLGDRLPDQEKDDDTPTDDTVRWLAKRKANYSPTDVRRLTFNGGVLIPSAPETQPRAVYGIAAEDAVIRAVRKLAEVGLHGNLSTRSSEYLPKLAKQYGYLDTMTDRQFAAALRECVKGKRLVSAKVGMYSNRNPKMGLVIPSG